MAGFYGSPIGWFKIEANERELIYVGMVDSVWLQAKPSALEQLAIEQIKEYFDGKRKQFDIPYTLGDVSDFTQRVFDGLVMQIGYGQTISYGKLAAMVGSAGASRAVGRAMASNPISVIVPCHRVIGYKDLGGYAWALSAKAWLLEHEAKYVKAL